MIMKIRPSSFLVMLFLVMITITACQKDSNDKGTTDLKIHLTDNPFNATEINVDLREVRVNLHDDSTGWISLNTNAGIYNLLALQNGVDTVLAVGTIPTGTLKEVRLVLGNDNSIKINNIVYPLTIPSGSESGLKIKLNKKLNASFDSLLIDFDAALSILLTGNGQYKLKPVLKIK
jgi:Domain of unknown function (DUF4382)